jgi:hypothetical protein
MNFRSPWPLSVNVLLGVFVLFDLSALGLWHFMVYRVNQRQPSSARLPHSLSWGGWNRLKQTYKTHYPQSSLYSTTVLLAYCCLVTAVSAAGVLWWQYFHAK